MNRDRRLLQADGMSMPLAMGCNVAGFASEECLMGKEIPKISARQFDAAIFDMDGVVTRTAHLHAAAWKKAFDGYLEMRAARTKTEFEPFSIESDYPLYVDGKPRYDGVRDFLASRRIKLPEGEPADEAGKETVCGIGNAKNDLFLETLAEQGVERDESTIDLLRQLRAAGIKTAVISSSKNARAVLNAAQVNPLFDVRIDGLDADALGIPGKPKPDIFLAAAKALKASPRRSVIVEDAVSGVQAGRSGGFGLVIGIDRTGIRDELAKSADVVVDSLAEIGIEIHPGKSDLETLPSALAQFDNLTNLLKQKKVAVFLDYDGTLTPIVERPELATISEGMRETVRELARSCPVAIISGRDRKDVERLADVAGVFYVGSHGFDIIDPDGQVTVFQDGVACLPALDRAEAFLGQELGEIEGAQVERKKFAIAVHFRRVPEEFWPQVEDAVNEALRRTKGLCKSGGKRIFEVRPDIDWNKGKALAWVVNRLGLDRREALPIYIGDDLTDEDALREIADYGVGILVGDEPRQTYARYALENPDEVGIFLQKLGEHLRSRGER